jgi:hypothetical protein
VSWGDRKRAGNGGEPDESPQCENGRSRSFNSWSGSSRRQLRKRVPWSARTCAPKIADRRHKAIQELLARGEPGRAALEELLHHELPLVRLAAATNVFGWAPRRAVPVLEELLAWAYAQKDSKRPGLRPLIAVVIMSDAEFLLSQHYGIRLRDVVRQVLGTEEVTRPWT